MKLKDLSRVVDANIDIIICQKIKYDNTNLPMKSNKLSYDEFKWLVEKSDRFACMSVDGIFARDNNLYICIF